MIEIASAPKAPSADATLTGVVFHVDLHAGPLDDAADHLAARPDDVAILVDRSGW